MIVAACILDTLWIQSLDDLTLKSPSSAPLLSKYILRLGQSAQKQQRPLCPNRKMYLEIREADEGALTIIQKWKHALQIQISLVILLVMYMKSKCYSHSDINFQYAQLSKGEGTFESS